MYILKENYFILNLLEKDLILLKHSLGAVYAMGSDFLVGFIAYSDYVNMTGNLSSYLERQNIEVWDNYETNTSLDEYSIICSHQEIKIFLLVINEILTDMPSSGIATRLGAQKSSLEGLLKRIELLLN